MNTVPTSRRLTMVMAATGVIGAIALATAGCSTTHPAAATAAAPNPIPATTSTSAPPAAPTPPSTHPTTPAPAPTGLTAPPPAIPLSAAQIPAAATEHWQPTGTPLTRTITGHPITLNECATLNGATTWTQQGYIGVNGQDPATEDLFTFPSVAAAQAAYTATLTGMTTCQATTRALQTTNHATPDATVTQTATTPDATAWQRTWTGIQGLSAPGPQTNHNYFALHGTTLVSLQFTDLATSTTTTYNTANDAQVLSALDAQLAQ